MIKNASQVLWECRVTLALTDSVDSMGEGPVCFLVAMLQRMAIAIRASPTGAW
jgi:hypothetical protein